ncbi:MAG TPA: hypothetical protein VGV92_07040 [Gammaproteobacteria bacterium]|nr:hypothetical protein [Gammaproteobacteria bacterium]
MDRLKHSGVSEKQAKAFADAHKDSLSEMDIATKQDINELKQLIKESQYQMTIKFDKMLFAGLSLATTIIVALIKFL